MPTREASAETPRLQPSASRRGGLRWGPASLEMGQAGALRSRACRRAAERAAQYRGERRTLRVDGERGSPSNRGQRAQAIAIREDAA